MKARGRHRKLPSYSKIIFMLRYLPRINFYIRIKQQRSKNQPSDSHLTFSTRVSSRVKGHTSDMERIDPNHSLENLGTSTKFNGSSRSRGASSVYYSAASFISDSGESSISHDLSRNRRRDSHSKKHIDWPTFRRLGSSLSSSLGHSKDEIDSEDYFAGLDNIHKKDDTGPNDEHDLSLKLSGSSDEDEMGFRKYSSESCFVKEPVRSHEVLSNGGKKSHVKGQNLSNHFTSEFFCDENQTAVNIASAELSYVSEESLRIFNDIDIQRILKALLPPHALLAGPPIPLFCNDLVATEQNATLTFRELISRSSLHREDRENETQVNHIHDTAASLPLQKQQKLPNVHAPCEDSNKADCLKGKPGIAFEDGHDNVTHDNEVRSLFSEGVENHSAYHVKTDNKYHSGNHNTSTIALIHLHDGKFGPSTNILDKPVTSSCQQSFYKSTIDSINENYDDISSSPLDAVDFKQDITEMHISRKRGIANLNNEVSSLKTEIFALQTSFVNLQEKVFEAVGNLETMQADLHTVLELLKSTKDKHSSPG